MHVATYDLCRCTEADPNILIVEAISNNYYQVTERLADVCDYNWKVVAKNKGATTNIYLVFFYKRD
jgi:hypothetical protein